MRYSTLKYISIFVMFLAMSGATKASVILDVSGNGDSGQGVSAGEAVAVSFSTTAQFNNVSITAPIECFACIGSIWLHPSALGSTAPLTPISAFAFNSSSNNPFIVGVNLLPDDYFLILSIDSGFATWLGSSVPNVNAATSITSGPTFSSSPTGFVPTSTFNILNFNSALHFTVSNISAPSNVSEPTSLALLFTAFIVLALRALLAFD
ncbi:hypothetical protein N9W11_01165 [Psychrosphaera haliotis]|nr:hypothetical protein [Psychrosphaera haliotis]